MDDSQHVFGLVEFSSSVEDVLGGDGGSQGKASGSTDEFHFVEVFGFGWCFFCFKFLRTRKFISIDYFVLVLQKYKVPLSKVLAYNFVINLNRIE